MPSLGFYAHTTSQAYGFNPSEKEPLKPDVLPQEASECCSSAEEGQVKREEQARPRKQQSKGRLGTAGQRAPSRWMPGDTGLGACTRESQDGRSPDRAEYLE